MRKVSARERPNINQQRRPKSQYLSVRPNTLGLIQAYCIITRARCHPRPDAPALNAEAFDACCVTSEAFSSSLGYLQGLSPTPCCIRVRPLKSARARCPTGTHTVNARNTWGQLLGHMTKETRRITETGAFLTTQTGGETCRSSSRSSSSCLISQVKTD